MKQMQTCPQCGAVQLRNAPRGQCPACLYRLALALGNAGIIESSKTPFNESAPESQHPRTKPASVRRFGDYELLMEIGRGGMGVVYRARQASLNRSVALKLIRAGELANEEEVARFRAEAEAAAHLEHPNIVPVYEVGEHAGQHFFSMKLVEGGSLLQLCPKSKAQSPTSAETAVGLLSRVARAIHYAHQRGILHRDLKPGNILLDPQGQPHVTDFGLAKRIETDSSVTLPGAVLGTPSYIAPEQAAGAKVLTTSVDVYSLGAILHELLTGRPPFEGATALDTLLQVREQEVKPLRLSFPQIDRDLETICLKCLEKAPARRYGSAEALAEELERWLAHEPIAARPVTVPERVLKWARRKPAVAILVVGLQVVGLAGLAGIMWQWREAEAATREKQEQLWASQLLEARYHRTSGKPGQQAKAVEVLKRAAAYRASTDLRNEALAAMLLPDTGEELWFDSNAGFTLAVADARFEHYVPYSPLGQIEIRRAADQSLVTTLEGLGGATEWMEFSPDGRHLAVCFTGDGTNSQVGLWDWRAGRRLLDVLTGQHVGQRPVFDFIAAGREIVIAARDSLRRFELETGRELEPFLRSGAYAVRVSPGGRHFALYCGKELQVWNLAQSEPLVQCSLPAGITDFVWHPNAETIAFGTTRSLMIWKPFGNPDETEPKAVYEGSLIARVFFNHDGDLLFGGGDGDAGAIWDARSGAQLLQSREGSLMQMSRDGRTLLFAQDRKGVGARRFLPPRGLRRLILPPSAALGGGVSAVDYHPEGRWLVSAQAGGLLLWNAENGRVAAQLSSKPSGSVKFLPDGRSLLSCGHEGVQLRTVDASKEPPAMGEPTTLFAYAPWRFERIALSPDGKRFAAVSSDHRHGIIAEIASTNFIRLEGHPQRGGTHIQFSPDARWVLTGSHHGTQVHLYDSATGRHLRDLENGTGYALFQRRGPLILATGVGSYSVWRADTGELLRRITGAADLAAFSPEDSFYLVGGQDGYLRLRDTATHEDLVVLNYPATTAWGAAFTSDGQHLAANNSTAQIQMWNLAELRRELAGLGLDW